MEGELVWGVADALCRHCQSILLLVSPALEAWDSNLTGKTTTQCSSCGHRTAVRDLPQTHQSQIAARLRQLLDDDDLVHVAEALTSLIRTRPDSQPNSREQSSSQATAASRMAESELPERSRPEHSSRRQAESGRSGGRTEESALPVDTSEFQLVAKLGVAEARLLGAVPELPVGEIVPNRKRDPNFAVIRLRIPIVEPAFFTEIGAELVRYKASGRRSTVGFSLMEIEVLRRGLSTRRDVILTKDSLMNTVGLLRFHRMKGEQVAAVEIYRKRSGPRRLKGTRA